MEQAIDGILISVMVGVLFAALSAVGIAWLLGASTETLLSLAPKSVTTPVAMGISETIGGLPSRGITSPAAWSIVRGAPALLP